MFSLKLLYKSPLATLLTGWKKKKKGVVVRALDDPDLEKDPLRAEYVKSIPEAQLYKGVLLQGYLIPTDLLEGLDDMSIRKDDVFIITYPKSGTTWTEEIVSLIYKGGDVSKVEKELLFNRVHHLEVGRPIGHLRFLQKLRSPRLMATHLPLPLLPRELKRHPKCKVIYVMRNPKDTAVSFYHHHKISNFLGNSTATWDQFLDYFMSGNVVYGSWFDHVLPYWEFCKHYPNNIFFIAYEELKLDLKGMVHRLCEFLEQSLEDEVIDTIVEHCTFERMKTNNMVNREVVPIPDLFDMSKSKFMRKGIIGDWKNYFTKEQSEAFNRMCRSHMSDSDLPLVFEPEEAAELLINEGRIIFNHPQRRTDVNNENIIQNDDEDDDEEIELHYPQYEPRYPDRSSWLPSVHLHVLPDPLTLDAVG